MFEMPQNQDQLRELLDFYGNLKRKRIPEDSKLNETEAKLRLIDENPEDHKDLLIITAETLHQELSGQIAGGDPNELSMRFFTEMDSYIKVSELLNDGFSAWDLVKDVGDIHLNYYDGITNEQFRSYDRLNILRIVTLLKTFNKHIPGIQEAINMQAEAELLYANYLRSQLDEQTIDEIVSKVRISFESALNTALLGTIDLNRLPEDAEEDLYSLMEDVVASYGDWLIKIGDKKTAKELCEEVYLRNPNTTIYSDLGFLDPHEESLRRRATKKALTPEPVRANADARAEGLQLEVLLEIYEGRVLKAAKVLEILAELDQGIAQQTSKSISGGHPLFKDPYRH